MPLTIAVTGAAGEIGKGVARHALEEGHNVVAIDRAATGPAMDEFKGRYVYHSADLTDFKAFKKAVEGCDALVHLAAIYSVKDPENPDGPWLREECETVSCRGIGLMTGHSQCQYCNVMECLECCS